MVLHHYPPESRATMRWRLVRDILIGAAGLALAGLVIWSGTWRLGPNAVVFYYLITAVVLLLLAQCAQWTRDRVSVRERRLRIICSVMVYVAGFWGVIMAILMFGQMIDNALHGRM